MTAHVRERMSAYIDRELPQTERAGVETHLRECADCARAIEEMRAVDVLAREHEVVAPAGYFDGLPGRLRTRLSPRTRVRVPPWTLALAAGLVVAVLAPLVLREQTPSPLPPALEMSRPAAPPPAAAVEAPAPPAAPLRDQGTLARPNPRADESGRRERFRAENANEPGQRRETVSGPRPPAMEMPTPDTAEERPPALAVAPPSLAGAAAAPAAEALSEEGAAADEAEDDAPLVSDNSGPEREASVRTSSDAAQGTVRKARPADPRFKALAGRAARSAAEARALRDAWQAFVRDNPEGPQADAARVSALEAGAAAWRLGGLPEDRAQVERDGREYLRRPEAADKERVRALLAGLAP